VTWLILHTLSNMICDTHLMCMGWLRSVGSIKL